MVDCLFTYIDSEVTANLKLEDKEQAFFSESALGIYLSSK